MASRPPLSLYEVLKLCEYAFFSFYLAKTIRSWIQLQYIAILFAISSLFESLLAIFQYLNQGSLNGIFYYFGERTFAGSTPGIANASINGMLVLRPYATFSHPNVLAGYLLISLVLVWSFLLKSQKRWMRILAITALVTGSIALLLTYSRIAILLWVMGIILLLYKLGFQKIKKLKGKIIFLGAAFVILLAISFFPLTQDLTARFLHTSLSDESVVERTELLSASWTIFQRHLLFGVGLLNFIPSIAPLQKPLPLNLYLQPVHNIFVLISTETGIIGLGLFLWLLGVTVGRINNQIKTSKGTFFVLLLLVAITGLFDHYWLTLQQGQLLFATIIGLCWATYKKI